MKYYNSILDQQGIENDKLRHEVLTVVAKCSTELVAKIVSVNAMLHMKDPTINGEDLEFSILYITSSLFQKGFRDHMKAVDEKKERYEISKTLLETCAYSMEFRSQATLLIPPTVKDGSIYPQFKYTMGG